MDKPQPELTMVGKRTGPEFTIRIGMDLDLSMLGQQLKWLGTIQATRLPR